MPNAQAENENVEKMPLSIFKCFTDRQPATATLAAVVLLIKGDPRLKALTEAYRKTGSKTVKQETRLFAVACRFCGGKSMQHVAALTGLAIVDIDHVDPQALPGMARRAMADPHTLLCYVTISGRGLRIIYRYDMPPGMGGVPADDGPSPDGGGTRRAAAQLYHKAFAAGNAHYARLLGVQPDMQCKNLTRLSGLAHDPSAYLNTQAVPFTAAQLDDAAAQHARESNTDRQMQRIEQYFATVIAPQLERDGIAYESGSHNNYVMRVGYRLAEKRYAKEAVLQWAMKRFADYDGTCQVICSCFAAKQQERQARQGGPRGDSRYASVDDIKAFLDAHIALRHNVVTARVKHAAPGGKPQVWTPINDRTVNSLWSKMSQTQKVNVQDMYRVIDSDHIPLFNPFKSYLESLPQVEPYPGTRLIGSKIRPGTATDATHHSGGMGTPPTGTGNDTADGTDYIRQLAETVTVKGGPGEQQRWYLYLRKWLVAMVAAWIDDEVVNNVILVLIGEQGAYKTTWFNYLLPPCLSCYFYTKTNANRMNKDDLITLTQYALVYCEELDTMRPSELNQLKAAVTMKSINERAAYAHFHEHRKHIASFCGTGNNTAFLSDPTGNRRWLPFEVESIVSPREHPLCYDGIYAQALALYRAGFVYWFTKDDIQQQNVHNRQFETPRLELELVNLYFRKPTDNHTGIFMTAGRALQIISEGLSQKLSAVYVGRAFVELGFKRMRLHSDRGYLVEVRTAEEIRAFQLRQAMDAEDDQ